MPPDRIHVADPIAEGQEEMNEPVYVIGIGRTDFKRNLRKEGKTIRDVIVEAARAAMTDARIDPSDVQSGVVGNFASGLFTGQLHLGAFLIEADEKLRGIPTLHTEAACASGGVAVLTAAQQIRGGIYDVALVVGAEQQKTMSPADGAEVLAAASDTTVEKSQYGQHMFPKMFGRIAQLYMDHDGLTEGHLSTVVLKNFAHARRNPQAQMRDATMNREKATTACESNPRFAPPLKVTDCSQISDGAAAVLLCSGRFRKALGDRQRSMGLLGFGHTTDYLALERKELPAFPMARKAAKHAYEMASLNPRDMNAAEVHDCFSISELVTYEILGLAQDLGATKLLESGATALPAVRDEVGVGKPSRSIPVNPSGGLIADGHPVGATGVRQVVESFRQINEEAGDHQVPGARHMLTFNMGGSVTTSVAMIWGNGQ